MVSNNLKNKLDSFLGKNTRISEVNVNSESQEVCDLDTEICYTLRTRDGLIERTENKVRVNRTVHVESPNGNVKQLLNG